MSSPIEFGTFYRLLNEVKIGDKKKEEELEWLLAEYEHAKDSKGAFDELGQVFCHIGLMELYAYTGTDNIKYISSLETSVWDYLKIRMGSELPNHMVNAMKIHAESHELVKKISERWKFDEKDLAANLEDLARYVTEGILDIIE